MDLFLLHAVAAEVATRLLEQEVLRVSHLGESRYVLRFSSRARDNLLLSARPDLPRVHLLQPGMRVAEMPPDRFGARIDQDLSGAVLTAVEPLPWDRVLTLRFRLPRREDGATERRLVVEILGRSSNLLLLDEAGRILDHARGLRSEFRAPVAGAAYAPPPGRDAYRGLPAGPDALPEIPGRFDDPVRFLEPLSPRLAADLRAGPAGRSVADGTIGAFAPRAGSPDVAGMLQPILQALRDGTWSPVVYSSRPPAEFREGDRPGRDDLFATAWPLRHPPAGIAATPATGPSEAADIVYGTLERLRDFADGVDHHRAVVRREIERLSALIGKLEDEAERAAGAESHRRRGEALLAGLRSARIEGETACVPDPYDPDAAPIAVPIDPRRSLQDNAQAMFARYKKARRAAAAIAIRLRAARERREEWRRLDGSAAAVRDAGDLDRLRESMARLGLVHAARPARRAGPAAPAKETPARVRRHVTREGFVVLVGKSGEENDVLTFRVAAPHDVWLHAAGHAGAHVVVRNPQRLKTIPEPTLRAAAEIAAYYSGARAEAKAEVHFTERRHVHRRRGMPSGQVLLRRFRTIQVTPRLPATTLEEV